MTEKTSMPNRPASTSRKFQPRSRLSGSVIRQVWGLTEDTPEPIRKGWLEATFKPARATRPEDQPPLPVLSLQPVVQDPARALDELASVRGALKLARQGYRKEIYTALAQAYLIATVYRHDADSWQDFCQHRDWSGFKGARPNLSKRQDALRYVLRFAVGFYGKSATKRVNKLVAALDPAFQKKMPPAEVPDYIRDGRGIEALARTNAKRTASESQASKLITIRIPVKGDSAKILNQSPGANICLSLTVKQIRGAVIVAEIREFPTKSVS